MKTSSLKTTILAIALAAAAGPLFAADLDTSKGPRGNTSSGTPSLDNTQAGQSFSVYCPMMKTESVVTVASVDGKGRATTLHSGTRFAPGSCSFVLVRAGSGKETHMEMVCKTGAATVECKVKPCH